VVVGINTGAERLTRVGAVAAELVLLAAEGAAGGGSLTALDSRLTGGVLAEQSIIHRAPPRVAAGASLLRARAGPAEPLPTDLAGHIADPSFRAEAACPLGIARLGAVELNTGLVCPLGDARQPGAALAINTGTKFRARKAPGAKGLIVLSIGTRRETLPLSLQTIALRRVVVAAHTGATRQARFALRAGPVGKAGVGEALVLFAFLEAVGIVALGFGLVDVVGCVGHVGCERRLLLGSGGLFAGAGGAEQKHGPHAHQKCDDKVAQKAFFKSPISHVFPPCVGCPTQPGFRACGRSDRILDHLPSVSQFCSPPP
jgi:hypothetical protein